jgi:hypothetical protein
MVAQEPNATTQEKKEKPQRPQLPLVSENELVLVKIVPKLIDAHMLRSTADRLFGRRFYVGEVMAGARGPVQNILSVGNTIVVYDTKDRIRTITQGLAELEQAAGVKETVALEPVEVLEYAPSHVSSDSLERAIRAYIGPTTRRTRSSTQVSSVDELNRIIVRGKASELGKVRDFITKIDVPKPQVSVTCWIVQGSTVAREGSRLPLPDELAKNLNKLVSFPHLNALGMGLVRTSVESGSSIKMSIELEGFGTADIDFRPESFDPKTGTLGIVNCKCSVQNKESRSRQTFTTSTSVAAGGYTVLGALGSRPIFVALKLGSAIQ